jgi:parallel beta-helix repeat protein
VCYLHKKRIKDRDYYYTTIREKSGKTKTLYLGSNKRTAVEKEKSLGLTHKNHINFISIFLVVFAILSLGFIGFSFTGFVVEDITTSEEIEVDNPQEQDIVIEEGIEETIGEEVVEEETTVEENVETNETEVVEEELEIEINETEEVEINETTEINESETNQTTETNETEVVEEDLEIEINETEEVEINETTKPEIELNQTTETNESEIILNQTLNITNQTTINQTLEPGKNITELYYEVIINQPVKWEKSIKLENEVISLEVKIPLKADNITITKTNEKKQEIKEQIPEIKKETNLVTGNFFRNLITGFVALEEKEEEQTINIDGPLNGAIVEYYLPGPKAEETQLTKWKKQVNVSSEEHYKNILTYTIINNTPLKSINIYSIKNDSKTKVQFVPYDRDKDGLIDYIEWISSGFPEEIFEVEIVVLNVQSYPVVGGNWSVYFNTSGQADLTITGIDGTYFGEDLEFLILKCGDTEVESTLEGNSIVSRNYECNDQTSVETSKVITPGRHHLEFNFGGATAQAHNLATISTCQTLNTANEYYALDSNITDDDGTCFTIGATNITLDCQGYTIDGDADASGYGVIINNANYDNLTIKNCTIQQFARNLYVGVNSDDIIIENSHFLSGYYDGALTYSVENMRIENSSFSGVNEYGMYAWYTSTPVNINWTVLNSNFTGGSTTNDYGFQAGYFYNSTFINNRFVGGSSTGDRGFSINSEGENITFKDNVAISDTNIAVLFYNTDDSNISNNNITSGTSYGMYLYANSDDNIIDKNNITSGNGIYMATYSYRNNFTNNQVVSGTNYGLYMTDYAENNRFVNNNFSATTYSYYGTAYARNNEFINNTMTSTSAYAIYLNDHCGGNLFYNNLIKTTATGSNRFGIRALTTSGGNNITQNNITSEDEALRLEADSNNNHIENNNLTSTAGIAVYLLTTTSADNTFINNTINGGTSGLYATSAHTNTVLINNTFNALNGYGVYLTTGVNTTIVNNSIFSGTSNDNALGMNDIDGGVVENNIVNGTATAFLIWGGTEDVNFTSNNAWGALGNGNYYGAYLYGASTKNRFVNNSINSFHYRGIYLTDANNNTFINNNITAGATAGWDTDNGIDIEDAHYNNFTGNFINNTGGPGVRLDTGHNNTFRDNDFFNVYTGIYCVYCQMRQTDFVNNNISTSASGDDYALSGLSGTNAYLYLLNSTYDETAIYIRDAFSTVERLWYGTANVSNTNGQVNNSRVLVYNNESTLIANETTAETGLTVPIPMREYIGVRQSNDVLNKTYYNNYTFQVTEADHFAGSGEANMSSSKMIYITLTDWPQITILTNYPTAQGYKANNLLQIRANETRRNDLITAANISITFANGTLVTYPMTNGTDGDAHLWEYNYTINSYDLGGGFNLTAQAMNDTGYNYANDTDSGFSIDPQIIFLKTYDPQDKSKSFFRQNGSSKLKTLVYNPYENYPKILIKDSSDTTVTDQATMTSEDGTTFYYNYTLNGSVGFYNVTIFSNSSDYESFTYSFYQGNNWVNNFTDNNSNIFAYSKEINVSEPNLMERYFYPIDAKINFTENADINSIRVTSYNGSIYTEIPSQVYNYTATNNLTTEANVVWLTSLSKSENRTYYIHYNDVFLENATYNTDLDTYTTTSNYRFFNNSYYTVRTDSDDGAVIDAAWTKQGTTDDIAGQDPMQTSPSILTITLDSYSAQNDISPTRTLEYSGPILNKFTVTSYLSASDGTQNTNLPFNQTYWTYAKNNYLIYETNLNVSSTYNIENLIDYFTAYGDSYFNKIAFGYPNGTSTDNTISTGNGPDYTSLNATMIWMGIYNNATKTGAGDIFLNRTSALESSTKIDFWDQASYEFYKRFLISSAESVTAGSNYTSKIARIFWDGEENYTTLNDTYYSIQNTLNYSIGSINYGDKSYPSYNIYNYTPVSINDNESIYCYSNWTDDLRLKQGYVETNITGTKVNQSVSVSGSSSWINYTIPATDIRTNESYCIFHAKDIGNNVNSTPMITFTITDVTPPNITNITNDPSDVDLLDPGVTINVTANVTDKINLDVVTLQYYGPNNSTYNETTMALVTGTTYYGNFTASEDGNYTYRINATDKAGNNYTTSNTVILVSQDMTWNLSPSTFEAVSGLIGSTIEILNLTINNTADYVANFTITSTRDEWIYYNGSLEPFKFGLDPNNVTIINLTAVLPTSIGEYSVVVTVTHDNSTADPATNTSTGTVVAYQSGPYIWDSFSTASTSVLLDATNVNYTVKVKNLGNETATGVNNTIILPTGWTTSSSLFFEIASLAANDYEFHSILVNVPSDSATGTKTITSAPLTNNTNQTHNATQDVEIIDPVVSGGDGGGGSGGGGGGGGGGSGLSEEESSRFFSSSENFEVTRGEGTSFTFLLKNPYLDADLKRVEIDLEGFTTDYIRFSPNHIKEIGIGEERNISVEITAPSYFTRGEYEMEFKIIAEVYKNTSDIIPLAYTKTIKLWIFEVSRKDATKYRVDTLKYIDEMTSKQFNLEEIEKLLEKLETAYLETEFKQVKEIYEKIYEIYTNSNEANKGIIELENGIEEATKKKVAVEKTKRLLHLAKSSFERGEYASSLDRIKEAKLTMALEFGGHYVKEALYSMKENPKETTIGFSSFAFLIVGTSIFSRYRYIRRKLKKLSEEENLLMTLMREIQVEVFERAKLSMKEYGDAMMQYEERLNKVLESNLKFENKRDNLMRFKSKGKKLREERNKLLKLVQVTQKSYITEGKFETRIYENKLKSYSNRLADIEEQLATAEVKRAFRKK